ncbi:AEC family transporter [Rhodoplanes serenus]|uniref:AEC family transporter n=1 Tax=Rhodoplanes serenus TaxID=200615 RepID=UPI000DAD131A|nr:AEC family transporter [Rhodoplanes serenus]RAI34606.1 hypothetical protein CH340_08500 [Rhodoplanes serenus]
MVIFESLSGVFACLLMIALGYGLTARGWFDEATGRLFSRMVMGIAIPFYMIVSLTKSYGRDDLLSIGVAVVVPLCVLSASFVTGLAVSRLAGVPAARLGTFRAMFFTSNSGFIGFPVVAALFGEAALPYAVMYYLVQTCLFWTIGAWGLAREGARAEAAGAAAGQDGGRAANAAAPAFGLATLKNVVSPPLVGAMVAIALILGDIRLPTFLTASFAHLAAMTTPLVMLFLGIAIYCVNLRSVRPTRDMVVLIAGRFLIAPAVALAVTALVPVPELMRKVVVMEAAMPVMTQVSVAARVYGADAHYVAVLTAITTIMAAVTIPAWFLLLEFGLV